MERFSIRGRIRATRHGAPGLALIDASMSGNATNAKNFLNAFTNYGWLNGAPIRHPDPLAPTPLSHDGFDTMLAGTYYAYTKFSPSTGIPQMAERLLLRSTLISYRQINGICIPSHRRV